MMSSDLTDGYVEGILERIGNRKGGLQVLVFWYFDPRGRCSA